MPVSTCEYKMKSTVQTSSDPMIPIGMSRFGTLGFLRRRGNRVKSDIREKNHSRAGQQFRSIQNLQSFPVFGGINGVKFAG